MCYKEIRFQVSRMVGCVEDGWVGECLEGAFRYFSGLRVLCERLGFVVWISGLQDLGICRFRVRGGWCSGVSGFRYYLVLPVAVFWVGMFGFRIQWFRVG